MDAFAGAIGVSDSRGKMSPVVGIYETPHGDSRFYSYFLRACASSGYIESLAKGIRERSTSFDRKSLASIDFPDIPIDEQRRIADFLDDQVGRIDRLIDCRRLQCELLLESASARIEEVFSQFQGRRALKHLGGMITSGPRGWGDLVDYEGVRPFIRITNLPSRGIELELDQLLRVTPPDSVEASRAQVLEGDIMISITASIGDVALVPANMAGAAFSQHVARFRAHDRRDAEWIAWALQTNMMKSALTNDAQGGTKMGLSLADIRGIRVPDVAPRDREEVARRCQHIFDAAKQTALACTLSEKLLEERKRSLTTAAVTGAIEVTTPRASVGTWDLDEVAVSRPNPIYQRAEDAL